jgi:hypothetical protein
LNAATANGWELVSSSYSIAEVTRNLGKLPRTAPIEWQIIAGRLRLVRDVWTSDRPAVFGVAKDRPVLFTAARLSHSSGKQVLRSAGFDAGHVP